MLKNMTILY